MWHKSPRRTINYTLVDYNFLKTLSPFRRRPILIFCAFNASLRLWMRVLPVTNYRVIKNESLRMTQMSQSVGKSIPWNANCNRNRNLLNILHNHIYFHPKQYHILLEIHRHKIVPVNMGFLTHYFWNRIYAAYIMSLIGPFLWIPNFIFLTCYAITFFFVPCCITFSRSTICGFGGRSRNKCWPW